MTLSDVQEQLSIMQEHNDLHDSILKKVEKDVADLKKEIPKETPKLKQGRKSPRGLSACVRKVHASFDDDEQYNADERVKYSHNKVVTDKMVKDVVGAGDHEEKSDIAYAAKKYHEYLVRPLTQAQRKVVFKKNRLIQRRQRLFERCLKHAIG
ncbi:hypothetical protein GBAR_LOCUS20877 [Geodia barretti]|uniref:Uncharacterized protein n=1 Tax=Geodia barretti TaxID=519541 RepID=A0AA35SXT2_GEOBA|nr:hypothetical protein GBAR_LOCUS20877 [Geodia barretti]